MIEYESSTHDSTCKIVFDPRTSLTREVKECEIALYENLLRGTMERGKTMRGSFL